MAIYQFILTPLDKFYFGKERHPVRQDYFQESSPFPQQTGILGLLRHYLLLATGKIKNKDEWDDLIGEKSFNGTKNQKFGKIGKLFPTFICDDSNNVLLPVKELDGLFFTNHSNMKISYNNKKELDFYFLSTLMDSYYAPNQLNVKKTFFNDGFLLNDYSNPIPMFCEGKKDFSPKNFFGEKLVKLDKSKGIFIKHEQPGILKNYQAKTKEENSYFRIQFLKLKKGYHFSFLAEINEILQVEKVIFMPFGGENSAFKVTIKTDNIPHISFFKNDNVEGNIIHFCSDTVICSSAFEHLEQFIGETQFFRSMKTDAKNNLKGLYNLNRDLNNFKSIFNNSKLFIKKGSIAFVKNDKVKEFTQAIENEKFLPYFNIGYNYYKQLKNL